MLVRHLGVGVGHKSYAERSQEIDDLSGEGSGLYACSEEGDEGSGIRTSDEWGGSSDDNSGSDSEEEGVHVDNIEEDEGTESYDETGLCDEAEEFRTDEYEY